MNRFSVLAAGSLVGAIAACASPGRVGAGPADSANGGGAVMSRIEALNAAAPPYVDITWLSIANIHLELGDLGLLLDGFISRVPAATFYGGGGGLGFSRERFEPDVPALTRVLNALGGRDHVDLLMTGHSHWDHSFDTAAWSKLTGAPIIGSLTTCLQAQAQEVAAAQCLPVRGGEHIELGEGIHMWVVRWNHSGTSQAAPEQHDPIELEGVPTLPPGETGLRPGVAEDFPNGGGNRAYLFRIDPPGGESYSLFFNDSAGPADLQLPIVVDGVDYGAPLDNLRAAMREAALDSVDLWIGSSGAPIAELVVPVLNPAAYLPVHFDGLYSPFFSGQPGPFRDPRMTDFLVTRGVRVIEPRQYFDRWRLSAEGITPVPNDAVQRDLGFQ